MCSKWLIFIDKKAGKVDRCNSKLWKQYSKRYNFSPSEMCNQGKCSKDTKFRVYFPGEYTIANLGYLRNGQPEGTPAAAPKAKVAAAPKAAAGYSKPQVPVAAKIEKVEKVGGVQEHLSFRRKCVFS